MKLPLLAAYSTENAAAVSAWVLLEPSDAEQMGDTKSEVCGLDSLWDVVSVS